MWLVDIALRRPYTYLVMALMILLATPFVLRSTPTDILPDIKIPVVSVVWNYTGMAPKDIRERIVTPYEKALTTTVNDVEHIESQSMSGLAVVKVYFHPTVNLPSAISQITSISQFMLRTLPPGTVPPLRVAKRMVPSLSAQPGFTGVRVTAIAAGSVMLAVAGDDRQPLSSRTTGP